MRFLTAAAVAVMSSLVPVATAGAVIGGHPVARAGMPAVVRLAGCTGALITPTRVLTAAHCARDVQPGQSHLSIGGGTYRAIRVARDPQYRFEQHTLADPTPYAPPYDFALVELDRPVVGVTPLPLQLETPAAGQLATTIGYGISKFDPMASFGTLRAAAVVVRTDAQCQRSIAAADPKQRKLYKPGLMICVQDPDGKAPYASACNGDSGSPLIVDNGGQSFVAGVDAWGVVCGTDHNDPANYMTIASGLSFITQADPPWEATPAGETTISGTATVGSTLTCVAPPWAVAPPRAPRFDWETESGALGSTYVVKKQDAGTTIICRTEAPIAGGGILYFQSKGLRIAKSS